MQQKILLPIAFVISFVILSFAVFMVIKSRSQTTLIRTDMTTQGVPNIQGQEDAFEIGNPSESVSPTPVLTKEILLTITSPVYGSTVTTNNLTVQGITVPKAEVFVNDSSTVADGLGAFLVKITLDEGENPIIVVANDEYGNTAEEELSVTYEAPQE